MKIILTEEQNIGLISSFLGEKVMVYYNLHKHTFSIQKKGVVVAYADFVRLKDVEFRVREGGKEKVRMERRKNVHAFVIGTLLDFCIFPCVVLPNPSTDVVITYNPYKHDSFVLQNTDEPIYNAKEVEMINLKNKIFLIE